jgi:CubicO group peptidase (beta-lactamase class C family)
VLAGQPGNRLGRVATATRSLLLAVAALSLCCGALAAPADCGKPPVLDDGWTIAADPAQEGFDPAKLCEAVQAFVHHPRNLHGLVIERHGHLVAERYRSGKDGSLAYYFAHDVTFDPAQRHDLRSISKSVVSLLWGVAKAEGHTPDLDTPALDLFPELADLKTGGRERITVEDLLAMRSGLAWSEAGRYGTMGNDENGLFWRSDQAHYLFDRPLAGPPGTFFNYDGGHTAVLANILAQRTGTSLPDFAKHKLFLPLGIKDWEWRKDLRGRPLAYAGLRMRPRDVAKIGRLVLDHGIWHGTVVVPSEWIRASLTPRVTIGEGRQYGYQWWLGTVRVNGQAYDWAAGFGNGGQRLWMVPALDLVVVMTAGDYDDETIGRDLARLFTQIVTAAVP